MTVLTVPVDDTERWPTLGPLVCDFIEENLVFGPGDLRGLPYELDPEKRAFIWRMYEVYPKGHRQAGRRRFKRAGLSMAKGLAKTEFGAIISACELHYEAPVRCDGFDKQGRPMGCPVTDPYIPMVAYTEEQSEELAYGTLMTILGEGPLADDFDIGLERIVRIRGDGRAVPMANSPSARDGARTSFQVFDETHWWTSARLKQTHQTMINNVPKRRDADGWTLELTTAPEPGAGSVAEDLMEYARAIDEGRAKDAQLFYFHRQASEDHDLETEEGVRDAVIEASGPAEEWRDIDAICQLLQDPTTDRSLWARLWLNQLIKSSAKAFDAKRWAELAKSGREIPDGAFITLGFDGALFHDSTGIVATEVETGHQQVLGVWEQPYGPTGENWQVPAEEVDDVIKAAFERWDVWRLYADPPYWDSMVAQWAGRYGSTRVIEWRTNRYIQMAYALRAFQTDVRTGALSHDGNEALARHIANAHRHDLAQRGDDEKPLFNIRKERGDSPQKIDLAMAAVLSWEARNDAIADGAMDNRSGKPWEFGAV